MSISTPLNAPRRAKVVRIDPEGETRIPLERVTVTRKKPRCVIVEDERGEQHLFVDGAINACPPEIEVGQTGIVSYRRGDLYALWFFEKEAAAER